MDTERSARVLVVEDDPDILDLLEYSLRQEGFGVIQATSGRRALELAEREKPDLVLLDLMLPDLGGVELCRRLRARPEIASTPVIMVTARSEEADRVLGLEIGADDYITKPFSPRELVLRVRAVLRRRPPPAPPAPAPDALVHGPFAVDVEGHRVQVDGAPVSLTALEFSLLVMLLRRSGRVLGRAQLLNEVWGYAGTQVTTRTVDTHMKRLREKVGAAAPWIETVRGVGYRMRGA